MCGASTRCRAGAIPAYADERTAGDLRRTFSYVFDPPNEKGGGIPQIDAARPSTARSMSAASAFEPVPIFHGSRPILGFRFGIFAYLTDCNRLADEAWPLLDGVDIADSRRAAASPASRRTSPWPRRSRWSSALKPRQTYFTHICHDLPHAATNAVAAARRRARL